MVDELFSRLPEFNENKHNIIVRKIKKNKNRINFYFIKKVVCVCKLFPYTIYRDSKLISAYVI